MGTQLYAVKLLEEGETQHWTMADILEEINSTRSEDWTPYDESDWEEGWDFWVACGGIYSKPALLATLIITYGCGSNLQNCYSRVTGESMEAVHKKITEVTNGHYSFSYMDNAETADMIKRHNLTEVNLQPMKPIGGHY